MRIGSRNEQQLAWEILAQLGIHRFCQLERAVRKSEREERGVILSSATIVFPDHLAAIQDLQRGIQPRSH